MDRRRFLETCIKGGIGLSCLPTFVRLLSSDADALDSILERKDSIMIDDKVSDFKISPIKYLTKKLNDFEQYPSAAYSKDGTLWFAYTAMDKEQKEGVFVKSFSGDKLSEPLKISAESGFEYDPEIIALDDEIAVVWTSKRGDGKQAIRMRIVKNGKPGEEMLASPDSFVCWKPSLAKTKDNTLWLAWEQEREGKFEIAARSFTGGKFSDIIQISEADKGDARRPSIVCGADGALYAAYDVYKNEGNNDIYMSVVREGKITNVIQISDHPASDIAPSIDIAPDGAVWVAWHSNRKGNDESDIPRWFELRCVKNDSVFSPVSEPLDKNLMLEGENQSIEFPKTICAADGKIIILGRMSHNFCLQYYYKDAWSPLYRFPEDGWGGRGKICKGALDEKGNLAAARRDLGSNAFQVVSDLKKSPEQPSIISVVPSEYKDKKLNNIQNKIAYDPQDEYNFYFGETHGHTWMSDGMGDLDEYYLWYRDILKYDFCVLTDHDDFVSNYLLPSEWEEQKIMAEHYNKDGEFITLFGQEWTTGRPPKGFGHKNIYHKDINVPLMNHRYPQYDSEQKIFEKAKEIGAFAIPHHIGWTGVNWDAHDPVAQPLVEIVSNHGAFEFMGNQPIPHRGGLSGHFVADGLKKGLKFGIIGGSDSHGLIWHHHVGWKRECRSAGLTCVLAKDLSRDSIFEALKKRRCYAASGVKIKIKFVINDKIMMGEEATINKGEKVKMAIQVVSPEDIKWIVTVKDGADFNYYGGEANSSKVFLTDEIADSNEHYYYLRVVTRNGNMAWTSPIWIRAV